MSDEQSPYDKRITVEKLAAENIGLIAERDALKAAIERMEAALRRARDDMEGWGAYAAPNFQEKWDLDGDLAAIDEALSTHPVESDAERDERRADALRAASNAWHVGDMFNLLARAIAESDKKARGS